MLQSCKMKDSNRAMDVDGSVCIVTFAVERVECVVQCNLES